MIIPVSCSEVHIHSNIYFVSMVVQWDPSAFRRHISQSKLFHIKLWLFVARSLKMKNHTLNKLMWKTWTILEEKTTSLKALLKGVNLGMFNKVFYDLFGENALVIKWYLKSIIEKYRTPRTLRKHWSLKVGFKK